MLRCGAYEKTGKGAEDGCFLSALFVYMGRVCLQVRAAHAVCVLADLPAGVTTWCICAGRFHKRRGTGYEEVYQCQGKGFADEIGSVLAEDQLNKLLEKETEE